jgi:hypothetical protein
MRICLLLIFLADLECLGLLCADANLGLFEVAFGFQSNGKYMVESCHCSSFAWMDAFAEAVGGLLLFGFKPVFFFWLFAPC